MYILNYSKRILEQGAIRRKLVYALLATISLAFLEITYLKFITIIANIASDPENKIAINYAALVVATIFIISIFRYLIQYYVILNSKLMSVDLAHHCNLSSLRNYLNHSVDIQKYLVSRTIEKSNEVANRYFSPLLLLASSATTITTISVFMIVSVPQQTVSLFIIIFPFYLLFSLGSNVLVTRLGNKLKVTIDHLFANLTSISENVDVIRVHKLIEAITTKSMIIDTKRRLVQSQIDIALLSTRFFIEPLIITIVFLSIIADNSLLSKTSVGDLTLILAATMRLLPSLQTFFASIGQLRAVSPILAEFIVIDEEVAPKKSKSLQNKSIQTITYKLASQIDQFPDQITVNRREFLSISGPSGSGKTTLLRTLLGLEPTALKSTCYHFVDGYTDNQATLIPSRISYVPQQATPLGDTVQEALDYYDDLNVVYFREICDLLNLTKILYNDSTITDRPIKKLSGGEKQRLCLAIALSRPSDFIFLDEPTSALDEENEKLVIEILRKSPKGIICISHNKFITELADKRITLK